MADVDLFWDLADNLIGRDGVEEGTIMSSRCLRVHGEFFAMPDRTTGGLVVKLPSARVQSLVDDGRGRPFAPAGRVFREWVLIPTEHAAMWTELLAEASAFVAP